MFSICHRKNIFARRIEGARNGTPFFDYSDTEHPRVGHSSAVMARPTRKLRASSLAALNFTIDKARTLLIPIAADSGARAADSWTTRAKPILERMDGRFLTASLTRRALPEEPLSRDTPASNSRRSRTRSVSGWKWRRGSCKEGEGRQTWLRASRRKKTLGVVVAV